MSKKVIPQVCPECKKLCAYFTGTICHNCYRKYHWVQKLVKCKHCGRMRPHKAKGFCNSCHIKLMHYDSVKKYNARMYHHLDLETYRRLTQICAICGFDKFVDLHHLDCNHSNNSENNLIGLCPNHHRLIHDLKYGKETEELLRQKNVEQGDKRVLITLMMIKTSEEPEQSQVRGNSMICECKGVFALGMFVSLIIYFWSHIIWTIISKNNT